MVFPFNIQLPTNGLKRVAGDDPSAWASSTHVEYPDEAPGAWVEPGPALAILNHPGRKQYMVDLLAFLFASISVAFSKCID